MQAQITKKIKYAINKQEDIKMKDIIFIRIDKIIKQKLDNIALDEKRSLNNLVCLILENYVKEKESN